MNVLILTKTFPDRIEDWSGIFVKEQADAIVTEHSVTVVKCRVDYNNFNPFFIFSTKADSSYNYVCFNILVSRSFPVYNQLNYILSTYMALLKIIKENRPDIIHCHYAFPVGFVAWLIRLKTGIPYLVTEHSNLKSTFRSIFHKYLSLIALKKASVVIAVSNSLKKELVTAGIKRTEVVPNVINTDRFIISIKKAGLYTIGFLGSLNSHNKGLDILLKACRDMPFDYSLKIGGTGKYLQYYKDWAMTNGLSGKTVFLENVSPGNINSFYSDINLFVLPSRYETFGIVLVEAMSSGIPVISTRCGGPEDIVNHRNGILIEIDDPDGLKEAIISIHSNKADYKPAEIRDYAIDNYGFKPFLKKINSLYNFCLSAQDA